MALRDEDHIALQLTLKAIEPNSGSNASGLIQSSVGSDPQKLGDFVGKVYTTILAAVRKASVE